MISPSAEYTFIRILHLRIWKNLHFRKPKLVKFRKLHAFEKYPFYSNFGSFNSPVYRAAVVNPLDPETPEEVALFKLGEGKCL